MSVQECISELMNDPSVKNVTFLSSLPLNGINRRVKLIVKPCGYVSDNDSNLIHLAYVKLNARSSILHESTAKYLRLPAYAGKWRLGNEDALLVFVLDGKRTDVEHSPQGRLLMFMVRVINDE